METAIVLKSYSEIEAAAKSMAASGYFQDARSAAQAVVKILAGQELGFGPFASMTGVYIIQGRPSIGANLMAAAVKKSGRYNYRIIEMTDKVCEIAYSENGQEIGRSRFTLEDAHKAGTKNLDKFPRNMLFARAMSNGVRWFCPDVFAGAPLYTPEELGANVNESGDVIDIPAVPVETPAPEPAPAEAAPEIVMTLDEARSMKTSKGEEYYTLSNETLAHMATSITKKLHENGYTQEEGELMRRKLVAIRMILSEQK